MEALQRHKTIVIAVILLSLSIFTMFMTGKIRPGKRGGRVADVVNLAVGTTQYGVSKLLDNIKDGVGKYTAIMNVAAENRELKRRLKNLQPLISGYRRLQMENMRLRTLVGYTAKHPQMDTLVAHVVARSLNPYFRVIRIRIAVTKDKKIPQNAAILVPDGIVGRVLHSFGPYADCLLLSDKRSRVPAYAPRKHVQGLVVGLGTDLHHRMVFRVLASEKALSEGTIIVTSGRDGVFPEGMDLGVITDVKNKKQHGLYVDYPVEPKVNLEDVQDLLVVIGSKEAKR